MAFSHGSKAKVYVGGVDLSAFLSGASRSSERDMAETSTLGSSDKAFIPGLRGHTLSAEGYFDGGASAVDERFESALSVDTGRVLSYLPAGDVFASPCSCGIVHEASYEVETPVDGVAAVTAELQVTGRLDRGLILRALAAATAGGNGTGIDNAASSSDGGAGFLQVTAFSGFTNIVAKVQHSTDGSSWSDLITFATVTGITSERVEVAGTVNRHTRALWTVSGTGSATFHVAFARR